MKKKDKCEEMSYFRMKRKTEPHLDITIEILKNKQTEISYIMTEMKNILEGINNN